MLEGVWNEGKHLQSLMWLDVEPAIMFLTSRVKAQEHDSEADCQDPFCTDPTITIGFLALQNSTFQDPYHLVISILRPLTYRHSFE